MVGKEESTMIAMALSEIPLFQGLSRPEIEELSTWLRRLEYEPGQEIFAEGSPPDGLYIVARGQAEVRRMTSAGPCAVAALEGPCVFGEIALLNHETHSASVRARTKATVGLLPLDIFEKKLSADNTTALRLALHLGRVACQRLRATTDKLLELVEASSSCGASKEGHEHITKELTGLCHQVLRGQTH
jgi:CRP-like cAMP-binding protein